MPDTAMTLQSPLRLALRRVWRQGGARFGAAVLAIMLFAAVYAPFLAGDVALVWRDADGWRLPILSDLFNKSSYGKHHDLLFNLAALLLPVLLFTGWLLRRRWTLARRILLGCLVVAVGWGLCQLPLLPSAKGWSAIWSLRGPATETVAVATEARAADRAVIAVFPPVPHRFDRPYAGAVLRAPLERNPVTGARLWLGSDANGKDVLAYLLFGARISLTIGLVATGIAMVIGTILGAISGYFGGKTDLLIQRVVEIMMCFPTLILVLSIVAILGRDIFVIMLVLGLTGWAGTARLVRGEFLAQSVRDYVLAAESLGLPRWRIMFRHILPNALTPLLISATFGIAGSVLTESGLAFIGLGDINAASWGVLLDQGRSFIRYPWIIYAPGIAVFLLVSSLNLVGSALSDALNPKGAR
ncbi:MAG: ABC transporter permease [Planctomycetes bacterium]|nr:ABC transporter permease [Planctomycetota bacterium]